MPEASESLQAPEAISADQLVALQKSEMEDHIKNCLNPSSFTKLDPEHLKRLDEEIKL